MGVRISCGKLERRLDVIGVRVDFVRVIGSTLSRRCEDVGRSRKFGMRSTRRATWTIVAFRIHRHPGVMLDADGRPERGAEIVSCRKEVSKRRPCDTIRPKAGSVTAKHPSGQLLESSACATPVGVVVEVFIKGAVRYSRSRFARRSFPP